MSHLIVPGLAFAIASSPATFKLTRKVAGPWVSSFEGVATPAGLFLHTLFFLFILYLVGRFLPRMSGYGWGQEIQKQQDRIKKQWMPQDAFKKEVALKEVAMKRTMG